MIKVLKTILLVFIILSSLYVSSIFVFPLLRISFAVPFFSSRNPDPYRAWNLYLFLDVIPFIGVSLSYLIYLIFSITSLYLPHKTFSQNFLVQYWKLEFIHKVLIFLTLPFLFILGFVLFSSSILHAHLEFGIMTVAFVIFLWILWFIYSKKIFSKIFAVISIFFAFYGILFLTLTSIPELHPHVYGKFSLRDPKGIYMINYDGDYWLTYYLNKPICWQKNNPDGQLEKICKDNLVKKGNTVIIEAPTDLHPYLDRMVKVQGNFVPVLPPIYPDNPYREFCVIFPKKSCRKSKGPGTWYFSPLKLQSVELLHK